MKRPGHLARMPGERLPKRVLFRHMDGSGVRGRSQKQWVIMAGKTCSFQGFHSHSGGNPETGQAGGPPQKVCSNAPDLRIEKRVMSK